MWYNLVQHHFDEKYWGPDARDFNPTRFLEQKKKGESSTYSVLRDRLVMFTGLVKKVVPRFGEFC